MGPAWIRFTRRSQCKEIDVGNDVVGALQTDGINVAIKLCCRKNAIRPIAHINFGSGHAIIGNEIPVLLLRPAVFKNVGPRT